MAEPVTRAEAKAQIRVDSSADDALIDGLIVSAREWVEKYTGLILTAREVTERVSSLASPLRLRAWPVDEAQPASVGYRDSSGTDQVISGSVVKASTRPAVVYPQDGTNWPGDVAIGSQFDVTFTAGYANPADVPMVLKRAILVLITAFYEDREGGELFAQSERSAKALCRYHRRYTL